MTTAEIHRGPDGSGLRSFGMAVFGHRRLAIIDLSPSAAQPMSNEDGSIWVTFNGELYNFRELRSELIAGGHVFQSESDTEVILHGYEEWGIDGLLERLRGMFAFGLYDPQCGVLLARDRLGSSLCIISRIAKSCYLPPKSRHSWRAVLCQMPAMLAPSPGF